MLLRGLLGHVLLLDGGGRGEGFGPLLGWSCGCHRGGGIGLAWERRVSVRYYRTLAFGAGGHIQRR